MSAVRILVPPRQDLMAGKQCIAVITCPSIRAKYFDGLVQARRISSALAMELRRSCTNPSI